MMDVALIQAVTASHIIVGQCAAIRGSVRLVEVLNQEPPLLLTEFKVYPLRQPSDLVASGTTCYVARDRIVWAQPPESVNSSGNQPHITEHDRIPKEAHPVVVLAPPFHITGQAHLPEAVETIPALCRLVGQFLPITKARIVIEGDEAYSWDAEVVIVNGRMVDLISLGPANEISGPAGEATVTA